MDSKEKILLLPKPIKLKREGMQVVIDHKKAFGLGIKKLVIRRAEANNSFYIGAVDEDGKIQEFITKEVEKLRKKDGKTNTNTNTNNK